MAKPNTSEPAKAAEEPPRMTHVVREGGTIIVGEAIQAPAQPEEKLEADHA